jgi:hypothetical protein
MSPLRLAAPLVLAGVLLAASACGGKAQPDAAPPAATTTAPPLAGGGTPTSTPATSKTTATTGSAGSSADWPSPADCISYDPAGLTTRYEAGIWTVNYGAIEVIKVHGDPSSNTGQKALALAQHYQRHCFLGRGVSYDDSKGEYIFDYWRDPSGRNPAIADQADDCSPYNKNNLTADDMGNGDGWRVKDHDHVLALFFTQSDANKGKLVLSKYSQICFIGDGTDGQDQVSYFL